MSEWEQVGNSDDLDISLLNSETGLPDNHVVTIRERRITVDFPTLIQNNVKTDTVTLDLDAEWDDVTPILIFGDGDDAIEVVYSDPATPIPAEVMEDVGTVALSVVGYNEDYTVRLVTVDAPVIFTVIKSGLYTGRTASGDTGDLLAQLLQAYNRANSAAQRAEDSVSGATEATTSANEAAEAANTAADTAEAKIEAMDTALAASESATTAANNAAKSANDAAGSVNTAVQNATAATEAANQAASAANSAAETAETKIQAMATALSESESATTAATNAAQSASTAASTAGQKITEMTQALSDAATATSAASTAASTAGQKITAMTEALEDAATATEAANTAAGSVNTAIQNAQTATTAANDAASSASSAAQAATTAAEAANTAAASIANKVDFEDILEGDNISITAADGKVTISAEDGLPEGGTTGQVVTKSESGVEWSTPEKVVAGDHISVERSGSDVTITGEPGFPTGGEPGQIAIRTADGYKWADISPEGAVVYNSTEKGSVLTVDDAYPSRPSELTVYGNTVQNLWVNPSGAQNGVTVTANADGSITLSGESTGYAQVDVKSYVLKPGTIYTLSTDGTPGGYGFNVVEYGASGSNIASHTVGSSSTKKTTFTTSESISYCKMWFSAGSGVTVSGTYRVMLNEGSTAEPWCPPGLNSVGDGGSVQVVTAGKNLFVQPQERLGNNGVSWTRNGDGSMHVEGTMTGTSVNTLVGFAEPVSYDVTSMRGKTVRISINLSGNLAYQDVRAIARFYDAGRHGILDATTGGVQNASYVVPDNAIVVCCYLVVLADGAGSQIDADMYAQLELGSTATAYEPPNITTTTIDLQGHTLNALPDGTRDELHIYGNGNVVLEKKCGDRVIDGTSLAAYQLSGTDRKEARFAVGDSEYTGPEFNDGEDNMLSDSLPVYDGDDLWLNKQRNGCSTTVPGQIGVRCNDMSTISAFNQYFQQNNMRVIYKLATPVTIPLTTAYLPSLPSPNATVYVADDTPAEIEMDYVQEFYQGVSSGTSLELPTAATEFGIEQMLYQNRNGLVYGYRMYKDADTDLEKIGDNRNIPAPTLSTPTAPGSDPYTGLGPFFYKTVNAKIKEDGTATITAIENDSKFSLTDPDGDVWILAPVIYERWVETDDYVEHYISDTPLVGYKPQPGAYLPDGSLRPYMLYAKYHLSVDDTNTARSVSGAAPKNFVSHNSLIDICKNATTGYSAYGVADDWYIKTMFYMKYGTKNSQSIFQGCTSYSYQYKNLVAEESTNRVIITKAQAANLVVGSNMEIGTNTSGSASTDRGNATAYDIAGHATITKIEDYDSSNSAVYFENIEPFTTTTNTLISTISWNSGTCDGIVGDGTPVLNNAKYPYVMQGIELFTGLYAIMGNVILRNSGSGWQAYVNWDSQNEKTDYDEDFYVDTGLILPTNASDSWKYPLWAKSYNGLISSNNTGGSSSTGMCDGIYTNKLETQGTRGWLSFGNLGNGSAAGVGSVAGVGTLSDAGWYYASRLSALGRSKG